jgi:hypothetical protein
LRTVLSEQAMLQTNCKPRSSPFVEESLLCCDRLLVEDGLFGKLFDTHSVAKGAMELRKELSATI